MTLISGGQVLFEKRDSPQIVDSLAIFYQILCLEYEVSGVVAEVSLASVGGGVALVPAAAAETVQDAFADAATDAADAGTEEEEDDCSEDDPNPDAWSTFSIHTCDSLLSVTVSNKAGTLALGQLVIRNTLPTPDTLHQPLHLLLRVLHHVLHSIVLQQVPVCCSCIGSQSHAQKVNQEKNCHIS